MSAEKFVPPTSDAPMLIGLLIDVSGSMTTSIGSQTDKEINRLQSFEQALGEFASRAGELSKEQGRGLAYVFAYGFGFGGILSIFAGGSGPVVRDLLEKPGERESTIPLEYLGGNWRSYQTHVESLAIQMFGSTPMGEGLRIARSRECYQLFRFVCNELPLIADYPGCDKLEVWNERLIQLTSVMRNGRSSRLT